jgi:hypothetical protein
MPYLPDGIVIERTPMRDLARRLVEALHDAGIPAWMAARPAFELASTGAFVRSSAWDIRVAEPEEVRARTALATARSLRLMRDPRPEKAGTSASWRFRKLLGERVLNNG